VNERLIGRFHGSSLWYRFQTKNGGSLSQESPESRDNSLTIFMQKIIDYLKKKLWASRERGGMILAQQVVLLNRA